MELIDKATVVAEIEKLIEEKGTFYASDVLYNLEDFLDTLEVKEKEVDLEQEIENELERTWYGEYLDTDKFKESAVYFYELGLKAKGE